MDVSLCPSGKYLYYGGNRKRVMGIFSQSRKVVISDLISCLYGGLTSTFKKDYMKNYELMMKRRLDIKWMNKKVNYNDAAAQLRKTILPIKSKVPI